MNSAAIYRSARSGEGLTEHLSTKDLGRAYVATLATEYVPLDGLEVEQGNEVSKAVTHARIVPGLC